MKTITTVVYTFDELNENAKEEARDWFRSGALDYDWSDSIYEDAETVGIKITGFALGRAQSIEGDFIGSALDTIEKIKANHGESCETYKTALRYEPRLRAAMAKEDYEYTEEYENTAHEFRLDILEDYRIMLEHEMEYILSDESVDESIRANEYTFTEDGKRF